MKIRVTIYPGKTKKEIEITKQTTVYSILEKSGMHTGNVIFILNGKILPLDAKINLNGNENVEIHSAFSGG
ncbi:MAG: hypothetical protein ACPL1Y_04695 [Thermoplasmata archaeon]